MESARNLAIWVEYFLHLRYNPIVAWSYSHDACEVNVQFSEKPSFHIFFLVYRCMSDRIVNMYNEINGDNISVLGSLKQGLE